MTTTLDVEPQAERPEPPDRRSRLADDFRALRWMLVSVGVVVVGAVVAIVVGATLYAPTHPLRVVATDYRFEMPSTLRAGTYDIAFANQGSQPHELLIFRTVPRASALPVDASGDVVEDSSSLHSVLDSGNGLAPGATQSLKVKLAAGHYAVVCNLPTHYRFGMSRDLTVR
jgi:uncharacterized cupredoxin-like copper-binding protein